MPEKLEKNDKITGMELRELNDKIVNCLLLLREQRDELAYIIEKQYEERKKLETEMERITYKLCLINKSLAQRIQAKENYDMTIAEIEEKYKRLVENSGELLVIVQNELDQLDSLNNKKTGTEDGPKIIQENSFENVITENGNPPDVIKVSNNKPTKNGKGDREIRPTNSSQASEIDLEMPTKLEKGETKKTSIHTISDSKGESGSNETASENRENSGDIDNSNQTGETSESHSKDRGRSAEGGEYTEESIQESMSSYEESIDAK